MELTLDKVMSEAMLNLRISDNLKDVLAYLRKMINEGSEVLPSTNQDLIDILTKKLIKRRDRIEKDLKQTEHDASFDISKKYIESFKYDSPETDLIGMICHLKNGAKAYEKKSDMLWKYAEKNKDSAKINYELLGNAVIERAVRDYNMGISGIGSNNLPADSVVREVTTFSKEDSRIYSKVHLDAILSKIKHTYQTEFVPYIQKNHKDILKELEGLSGKFLYNHNRAPYVKHKCPNCGGAFRLARGTHNRIECCGCGLSAKF